MKYVFILEFDIYMGKKRRHAPNVPGRIQAGVILVHLCLCSIAGPRHLSNFNMSTNVIVGFCH